MIKLSPKTIVICSAICFLGLVVLQFMWIMTAWQGEKALLAKEKKQFENDLQNAFNKNRQFKDSLKTILDSHNQSQELANKHKNWIINNFERVMDSVRKLKSNSVDPENFGIVRYEQRSSHIIPIALIKEQPINKNQYELAGKLCLHCVLDISQHEHSKYNYQIITTYSPVNKAIYRRLGLLMGLSFPLLLVLGILFGQIVKRYNQEKKLSHAKNEFINNLSHEIQTPVFAIQVANKLISEKSKNPETTPLSVIIEKETAQLKEHAAKILELASLENDQLELIKEKVELNGLIEKKRPTLELMVKQKNGSLEFDLIPRPLFANLDIIHFNNIVVSIVDNAIKYNNRPPEIILRTFERSDRVCISISDNGIGIAKEFLPFVFDKFYRVPRPGKNGAGGFGLGLNYVREVVRLHKGTVTIASEEGSGSTVTISLPTTSSNA